MRIRLLSDLHLEFSPFDPPVADADVVVLAGDTHVGSRGVQWAGRAFGAAPVIYVMGNHEYYGEAHPALLDEIRYKAGSTRLLLLENQAAEIAGVTFLGTTLWTDFALYGDPDRDMQAAELRMADYTRIRSSPSYRRLRARDTLALHQQSVLWLERQLAERRGERIVVVTHHAPTRLSADPRYDGDVLTPAFVSDLHHLVERSGAMLWVHGHVHRAFDYTVGATRVVCNPRGYPDERDHGFDPALVIDLE
jgi:Icc-related predicted phosphoesterase